MRDFEEVVRIAVGASFLARANDTLIARLVRGARVREVSSGRVFVDDKRSVRCGLIVSGLAWVYAIGSDGRHIPIRKARAGAALGIECIAGCSGLAKAQAITDVEFLELQGAQVTAAAQSDTSLAWAIATEMAARLSESEALLATAGQRSVGQRVATALLALAPDDDRCPLSLSQQSLAEIVGASRERVGQAVRALAAAGLIRVGRRRVQLLDQHRLMLAASATSISQSSRQSDSRPRADTHEESRHVEPPETADWGQLWGQRPAGDESDPRRRRDFALG